MNQTLTHFDCLWILVSRGNPPPPIYCVQVAKWKVWEYAACWLVACGYFKFVRICVDFYHYEDQVSQNELTLSHPPVSEDWIEFSISLGWYCTASGLLSGDLIEHESPSECELMFCEGSPQHRGAVGPSYHLYSKVHNLHNLTPGPVVKPCCFRWQCALCVCILRQISNSTTNWHRDLRALRAPKVDFVSFTQI